jgi:chromosome segregation ATPase
MALNNPDILYPLLDEMSQKVRQLNHRISYAIDDARQLITVVNDQTNEAIYETNYVANIKDEDAHKIAYWDHETVVMLDKTNKLLQDINAVHAKLQRISHACNQSLQHWDNEHVKALAWLQRAKARLATAISSLNMALNNLRSAESRLNSARNALSGCRSSYRTDSQGRRVSNDCSSHESAVSNAQQAVHRAQEECRYWEREKRDAEAEVASAEARVRRCNEALALTKQAIASNNVSIGMMQEADNYCRRTLEEIRSAGEIVEKAKEINIRQETLVQENKVHLGTAQTFSNEANISFIGANKLSEDVQLYGNMAGEEIDRKVDLLKEFGNTPGNL